MYGYNCALHDEVSLGSELAAPESAFVKEDFAQMT
jgi:hypothetical protein